MKLSLHTVLWLLMLCFLRTYAQDPFTSIDEYTGFWENPATWINEYYPGTSVLKADIECYGQITSNNCIDINLGTINVHDTLIINGNLYLLNKAALNVDSSAVLIVFGDFEANNMAEIVNAGTFVVAGGFTLLGSSNQGSFVNNGGEIYLFDTTPEIPVSSNYSAFECPMWSNTRYCGYGNYKDFTKSSIFDYYVSLPYSQRNISTDSNECFSYTLITDNKEICVDDSVEFSMQSVGITPEDKILWNFGYGAVPDMAYGYGPHKVQYTKPGTKSVMVEINSDATKTIDESNILIVRDLPVTGKIYSISNEGVFYDPYTSNICSDSVYTYFVKYNENSVYHWMIPDLNMDTINGNEIPVWWNLPEGEYEINVQEISSAGCAGSVSESMVAVVSCIEEHPNNPNDPDDPDNPDDPNDPDEPGDTIDIENDPQHPIDIEDEIDIVKKQTTLAFSPNGDGINDTWEIENIENLPEAQIYVYNRNGKLVYRSEGNYQNDWSGYYNGKRLPLNSYYYIIDLSKYQKGLVKGVLTILW
jgi:gliding motility-associated-like protein